MTRDRRRRDRNYTGILRGRGRREEVELNQIENPRRPFSWRIVSGLIVVICSGVLAIFFYADAFYVDSMAVAGTRYMTKEEVFTYANIPNNIHLFWVEPEAIRQSLMEFPAVADASVRVSWPPNAVNVMIEEREPALIWEQNGATYWIDVQGNVMREYEERSDLMRVTVDDPLIEGSLSNELDEAIVVGAVQLSTLLPEINEWRYDSARGIGFRNANGWEIWMGVGSNMVEKLQIYETLTSDIIARGIQPGEINIVNPDAPVYTVIQGR